MSTHSNIGILGEDGRIEAVYCHGDGYLTGVGLTLLFHYRDEMEIRKIIHEGALSYLGESIEGSVFYRRDRGELLAKANKSRTYKGVTDYSWHKYNYFYDPEKRRWFVASKNYVSPLSTAIMRDENTPDDVKKEMKKIILVEKINEIVKE